jgi:toxin YoeB
MIYKIILTKKALKHVSNLKSAGLYNKAKKTRDLLTKEPHPLNSKELNRDLRGKRSIRINIQHRLVYEVNEEKKVIKILSMWGHYDD